MAWQWSNMLLRSIIAMSWRVSRIIIRNSTDDYCLRCTQVVPVFHEYLPTHYCYGKTWGEVAESMNRVKSEPQRPLLVNPHFQALIPVGLAFLMLLWQGQHSQGFSLYCIAVSILSRWDYHPIGYITGPRNDPSRYRAGTVSLCGNTIATTSIGSHFGVALDMRNIRCKPALRLQSLRVNNAKGCLYCTVSTIMQHFAFKWVRKTALFFLFCWILLRWSKLQVWPEIF